MTRLFLAAISLAFIAAACGGSAHARSGADAVGTVKDTVPPPNYLKQLTGTWGRGGNNYGLMVVRPRGKVELEADATYHAEFSHVTAHRLSISYVPALTVNAVASCSRTGTYRWTITNPQPLKLKKIHDACKPRVGLFAGNWLTACTQRSHSVLPHARPCHSATTTARH